MMLGLFLGVKFREWLLGIPGWLSGILSRIQRVIIPTASGI